MAILFVDTESSERYEKDKSFRFKGQPHIEQIGLILTDDSGKIITSLSSLTKFKSNNKCFDLGLTERSIAGITFQLIISCNLIVGHNVKHDMYFIASMLSRYSKIGLKERKERRLFCTSEAYKKYSNVTIVSESRGKTKKYPSLKEAYEKAFNLPINHWHDAYEDAKACMKLYFNLQLEDRVEDGKLKFHWTACL